ncbi:hypothetical protein CC85DRAFT_287322 [Cutaneotrichosporon oleaginosum]|uniref:Uncharacterized protein n=1 Tax=Cutaneotrichosporon oleaginosum TaxID=879819 RepID=A0A0J0XHJ6_9TREE|nr:uncharacterized protein CC85DRAFT_287322 [Cutaneotrichosporon oleaginosum]KLT40600.1 hypothetical protein CC85DRAFT_287322 [Cutaneotrichosporon oleaginosum]TXT03924.1 hypothetical protein COLE_07621 [Cutaneotrichosporon oleaginosum]
MATADAPAAAMARLTTDFSDSTALSRHQQIHARLELEILDVREEVARLKGELRRDQDPARMGVIQKQIAHLMQQINAIREKAAEAEAIVKSITQDVQRLDVAKRNLTRTMQTLERWSMLKHAHRQLKELIPTKRYRDMASSLSAVVQLFEPLKPLTTISEVADVFRAAEADRRTVQEMVNTEMETFFRNDPNHPPDLRVVTEAALVVDVLGGDYRKHIIERYITLQLAEYRRIFRSTDEAGQLDNVPRRYAWFRRVLKHHDDENAALFPAGWEVTRLLVASFAEQTRVDLANVLGRGVGDVNVFLDALQATLDFEAAFARRFNIPFQDVTAGGLNSSSNTKWTISSIFDSHFGTYVDAQDKALAEMMSQYRGARSRSSLEGTLQETENAGPTILPSSTELFYFYGQTLEQCSKYTNGEPVAKLARIFAKWLKIYNDEVLLAALKREPAIRRSLEGRSSLADVKTACMVLNTAEYCANTSMQLEDRLKDKVKDELRESIGFSDERDAFTATKAQCIATMLRELETACDPAFAAILKTPWRDLENVSGRSAYIVDLVGSIKEVAECVRTRIESKKYIRNFADKAVGLVIARFTQAVIKSRPLKKIGAEQILLDVQAVKACLLDLPEPHPENSSNGYTKYVTKNTGQLETMLKVILAPDDPPEGFVQNYCLLIGDRSFTNFQKILDLKGTARADQQKLVDIFLSVTGTKDDLADTSFLTGLDMDPGNERAQHAPQSPAIQNLGTGSVLPSLLSRSSTDYSPDGSRADTPKAFGDFRRFVSTFGKRDGYM